jgi:heterodisulfide reductase subunit C
MAAMLEIEDINGNLISEIAGRCRALPMNCYQCQKCTNGCPVASRADFRPHEIVRLMQMDQSDLVLSSRFIWECTSCHSCATRCPQKVDIASINDALRALSLELGKAMAETTVPIFNKIFLQTVRKRGRMYELGLMAAFKLRTRRLFADFGKLPMMLVKRKLPLVGPQVGGRRMRDSMFLRAQGGNK